MAEKKTTYTLEAQDRFSAVLADFKNQLNGINNQTAALDSAFSKFKGTLEGLGVALSIASLVEWAKGAVNAADEIGKLSEKTGIAVTQLSAMTYGVKLSGADVETFGKGMQAFSKQLVAASDTTSQSAKIFRALGVDVTAGPEVAIRQFAEAVSRMADGETKATLVKTEMGKAAAALIPWLDRGAEGMRKASEEAYALGIVMGEDGVKAATKFKENMIALQSSTDALGITFVNRFGPGLVDATNGIKLALIEGGKLQALWVSLGALGAFLFTDKMLSDADKWKKKIAEINDEISFYNKQQLLANAQNIPDKSFSNIADRLKAQLRAMQLAEEAEAGAFQDAVSRAQQHGHVLTSTVNPAFDAYIKSLLATKVATEPATAASDALIASLEKEAIKTQSMYDVSTKTAEVEVQIAKLKKEKKPVDEDEARRLAGIIDQQKNYNETLKEMAKDEEALASAWKSRVAAADQLIGQLHASNAQLQFEIDEIGKSSQQRELDNNARQRQLDLAKAMTPAQKALVDSEHDEQATLINIRQERELQVATWTNLSAAAGQFFGDLVMHGKSAFDALKNSLKSFIQQLISLFAQKWVLQVVAGVTGSTALGAAANSVGAGTSAGGLLNGFTSLGSLLPGGGVGAAFSSGATSIAGALGVENVGYLSMIGEMASFVPIIGTAIAAISMLYSAFKDKGENWQATLGFGKNANAYVTQGVFGPEGFQSIQGDNALNTQIQQFMASTRPIDQLLAGNMTAAQIAQVQATLGGSYTTRNDGQPAQFAFGKGDSTAGQQLTLEYVQHKYGAIFDTIDKSFADHIRAFTGSSQDLLTEIGNYANAFNALQKLNIKGLDMTSLQAWQQAGETLPQTLQRIASAYDAFDQAFMSDTQKLQAAKDQVNATFAKLGIAVPQSTQDFYNLVHSIDVSTQSGRDLVTALLGVAPAFQTVTNAAQQAVDTFNSIAGSLSPTFGAANAKGTLDAAVQAWMALSPANQNGWTVQSTIANITSLVQSGQIGTALTYAQGLGGNAVTVLNQMLSAYQNWQSAMNTGTSSISTSANSASSALSGLASSIASAKTSIQDWLSKTLLSPLSTLNPSDQLAFAQEGYVENLLKAQKGDPTALANFSNYADTYLNQARSYYASGGQYSAIFAAVTGQAAKLSGLSDASRPPTAADALANTRAIIDALHQIGVQLGNLGTTFQIGTQAITKSTKEGSAAVTNAVTNGPAYFGY